MRFAADVLWNVAVAVAVFFPRVEAAFRNQKAVDPNHNAIERTMKDYHDESFGASDEQMYWQRFIQYTTVLSMPTHIPTPKPQPPPPTVHSISPITKRPTSQPSILKSPPPTQIPSQPPTLHPFVSPTVHPTPLPSAHPTPKPSSSPVRVATMNPTASLTTSPTQPPTHKRSLVPSFKPSVQATVLTTSQPTSHPSTLAPTRKPVMPPTSPPTSSPSTPRLTAHPTSIPTLTSTKLQTLTPTTPLSTPNPSPPPSLKITPPPTILSTPVPTAKPTQAPTASSTVSPSSIKSPAPSSPVAQSCTIVADVACQVLAGQSGNCTSLQAPTSSQCLGNVPPSMLQMIFIGGSCLNSTTQDPAFTCSDLNGGVGTASQVFLTMSNQIILLFQGVVQLGQLITASGQFGNTANVTIQSVTSAGKPGKVLQQLSFRTQCQDDNDLTLLRIYGALQLAGFSSASQGRQSNFADVLISYMIRNNGTAPVVVKSATITSAISGNQQFIAHPTLLDSTSPLQTSEAAQIDLANSATQTFSFELGAQAGPTCFASASYAFTVG